MPTARMTAAFLTAFFLGPTLPTAIATALPLVGNVSAGFGQKWKTEPSFPNPVHEGGTLEPTVNVMVGHRALPILLEGYISGTRQDGTPDTDNDVLLQTTRIEVGFGVAGRWRFGPVYSHFGGGIAEISSKTKTLYSLDPHESSSTRMGHWIGAGALLPLVAGFNVGAIGRYTNVDANPGREHAELGGLSASALIGWGWALSR